MGFNLGLAASAYQGGMAEKRRIADDNFLQAQREHAQANMDEYASRRANRDNAAGLADERTTAERELMPAETESRKAALSSKAKDLDFYERQRGTREQTGLDAAETAGIRAKADVTKAKDYREMSDAEHAQNGQKIDTMIAKGTLDADQVRQSIEAKIYAAGAHDGNTEHDLVERFNAGPTRMKSLYPELYGKQVASIKKNGQVLHLYDADGALLKDFPVAQLKAAYDANNPGKIERVADGQNLYRIQNGRAVALTDNVKHFNPNTGSRSRAGAAAGKETDLRYFARQIKEDAAARGQNISDADALRQAAGSIKANPGAWASRRLQGDLDYQSERDPGKRRAMEVEALESAKRLGGASPAPGLSQAPASPAVKGFIDRFIPNRQ